MGLRPTDGSPVVRLGEGYASDLSRDGKWALAVVPASQQQLVVYPTGAGEPRRLETGGIVSYRSGRFFPDSQSVLVCGHEQGRAGRCYVQAIAGGKPRAVTPEGTSLGRVSPDGHQIVVRESAGGLLVYPAKGGEGRAAPGATVQDSVIRWSGDGRSVLVYRQEEVPARVERLDISTGKRQLVRTLGPTHLVGTLMIKPVAFSEDEKSHAYGLRKQISHLFLVEGGR